jgi:hypothetical protein
MGAPAPQPIVLRAAAVWGTTVLALRQLSGGESMHIGEAQGAVVPQPDGLPVAECPIRAVGSGWELDVRGATGGLVTLRGRRQNPAELARTGAPIPIAAGDFGLLQYGPTFGIFFQLTHSAPPMRKKRRIDGSLVLAFIFALIAVLGGLALIGSITTPRAVPKPLELTSPRELALRFHLKSEALQPPAEPAGKDAVEPEGEKDGARDKTLAEALSSDVADEVRRTLSTISSVGSGAVGPGGSTAEHEGDAKGTAEHEGKGTAEHEGGKGAPKAEPGLAGAQIARVVTPRMALFRACYVVVAKREPGLAGDVSVRFSVAPSGSVSAVSVGGSLGHPRVTDCVKRRFERLRFPAADQPTNAGWTFSFKPRKK